MLKPDGTGERACGCNPARLATSSTAEAPLGREAGDVGGYDGSHVGWSRHRGRSLPLAARS